MLVLYNGKSKVGRALRVHSMVPLLGAFAMMRVRSTPVTLLRPVIALALGAAAFVFTGRVLAAGPDFCDCALPCCCFYPPASSGAPPGNPGNITGCKAIQNPTTCTYDTACVYEYCTGDPCGMDSKGNQLPCPNCTVVN